MLQTLDVVEVAFERPRRPIVELVGDGHQGAPILVLREGAPAVHGVTIGTANGHRFVEKTQEILHYLAATRRVPEPH